jgi:DNA primase
MAGKIPASFIQDVLARVDLVDLIDTRLPLKRSGSGFVARCPFHNEKTPSFNVSREKQFYHCFGCGANGNAIGFLMEFDRLTFPEAVETLADSVGLKVPKEESGGTDESRRDRSIEQLFELQERVCRFYQRQLKAHGAAGRAVEYLKGRGISGEIALRYRLGFAPPGPRSLPDDLPQDLLKTAGLLTSKDNGPPYDWFRERVVFPIRDRRGRVVGFGGRVIGEGVPKYLNSPETPVFKKHKEVYGLYELLNEVRKPEFIIVVEGYMDVIALAQFGIPNAVATLGTATSVDHINLLFRHANDLVFCFDGDNAGRNAAWKALEASLPALREGRQLRFLLLPEKHDPDSLVRAEGSDRFLARVKSAQPFSDYFFGHLTERLDLRAIEGRAALVQSAKPLIDKLPAGIFRDMVEQRLQELAGHTPVETGDKSTTLNEARRQDAGSDGIKPSPLRTVISLLLKNPELAVLIAPDVRERLERNSKAKAGEFVGKLLNLLDQQPHITTGAILEVFRDSAEEGWVTKLITTNSDLVSANDTKGCLEAVEQIGRNARETFMAALAKLDEGMMSDRLQELINKSKTVGLAGLSPEERSEFRMLAKRTPTTG